MVNQTKKLDVHFEEPRRNKNRSYDKVITSCALQENVERQKTRDSVATPKSLSVYTVRIPPENHPSCSDVPSWSFPIFIHTNSATLINTTMPHHPMSQHLRRLPYCNKFYHRHLAAFSHPICIFDLLHDAVSTLPSCLPRNDCLVHSV